MASSDIETMKNRLEMIKRNKALANKQKEEEKSKENEASKDAVEDQIDKDKSDECSIWVGSVDFSVKKEQLEEFFSCCGSIKRSTIPADHFSHKPKGYAYIEFENKEAAKNALALDNELFAGKNIKVKPKKDKPHGSSRRFNARRTIRRQKR